MECHVQVTTAEPIPLLLRARATGKGADTLRTQKAGDLLMVSGTVFLEGEQSIIQADTICPATNEQFFNEVVAVGRFGKEATSSSTGKSIRRSVAIDKLIRSNTGEWTKEADWINIRAYKNPDGEKDGSLCNRLEASPNGSLIQISGALEARKNKDGNPYIEIKARRFKVHRRGGQGNGAKPEQAKDLAVGGYEEEDFRQDEDMPTDW